MTDPEDRLRRTLAEVAARVEPGTEPPVPASAAPLRRTAPPTGVRRPATVAVAIVAAVATVGGVAWRATRDGGGPDRTVAAGSDPAASDTTAVEAGPAPVLRVEGDGLVVRLRPVSGDLGRSCVRLDASSPVTPAPSDVCLDPGVPGIALSQATVGSRSVLYGLGASVTSFSAAMAEVAVPVARQDGPYGPVRAFVMIWDVPTLNGVVYGSPADPDARAVTALVGDGLPGLELDPPSPLPVDVPFDDRMLFAYKHQGQVWAILASGANVRLTGGRVTGFPSVAPDGDAVLFARNADALFADTVALDVRTGKDRVIGSTGQPAFSNDGRIAFLAPVDDDVPIELVIGKARSFDRETTITLGPARDFGGPSSIAWSADGRVVLVAGEGGRLWTVDVARRTVRPVEGVGGPDEPRWAITRGTAAGWPAVRSAGGTTEIGVLRVEGGRGTFRGAAMATATAEAALDPSQLTGFAAVGTVRVEMLTDVVFTFRPAAVEAFVVSDEEEVFLVTAEGELTYLLSDARGASAP